MTLEPATLKTIEDAIKADHTISEEDKESWVLFFRDPSKNPPPSVLIAALLLLPNVNEETRIRELRIAAGLRNS
jgi:hypothetical protein